MELKTSNGMRLARSEVISARARHAAAAAVATETARQYREGALVSIEDVHAADARAEEASRLLGEARRRYESKRSAWASTFLERLAPVSAALRENTATVADNLEAAIADARAAESFATSVGLPVTQVLSQVGRCARIVRELREISNS